MTSQLAEGVAPSFTEEEKAYFENRGNPPASQPVEDDADEPMDLVEEDAEDEIEEPEGDEEGDEDEPSEKPKKQVVPIKALHKEREARKQLDQQLRQAEADRIRLEERMNALLERFQPPQEQQQEERVPTFDEDPIAAMQAAAAKQQTLEQQLAQFQEQQRLQAEAQQIAQYTQYHEQEFLKTTPDYYDAMEHLKTGRIEELRMLGYGDEIVAQVIRDEARQIITAAAQSGRSPAEVAYAIAKQRGYMPKSAAPVMDAKPSTKSLSQASGSPAGAKLTAQDVLRMSSEEFERFAAKNPKKFRQLLGG